MPLAVRGLTLLAETDLAALGGLISATILATAGGTVLIMKQMAKRGNHVDSLLEKAARSGRPLHIEAIIQKVPAEYEARTARLEVLTANLAEDMKCSADKASERYEHLVEMFGQTNQAIAHMQGALSAAGMKHNEG